MAAFLVCPHEGNVSNVNLLYSFTGAKCGPNADELRTGFGRGFGWDALSVLPVSGTAFAPDSIVGTDVGKSN
jgi:hypothetical protein